MQETVETPRPYATSNATRLLSAGAYLERHFRKRVIHELVKCDFRFVAPSYGYDAVTVLAHALAARRLWRQQIAGVIIGLVVDLLLLRTGVISDLGGLLIAVWLLWAFAFLRRAATLQALSRLRTAESVDDYPANAVLTPALVEKIAYEQGQGDTILYGRFFPFVGAGLALPDWSTAELLIPAAADLAGVYRRQQEGRRNPERPPVAELAAPSVVPFTVTEITDYVAKRLRARLQEDAEPDERIDRLTIERRNYSGAARGLVVRRGRRRVVLAPTAAAYGDSGPGVAVVERQDARERYDATREYLCIRIGAWDEEVVVSMFVGFDLRGNTLYSEFHPCLLPPVQASFHLVDRLPARLTPRLLLRVALGIPIALVRSTLSAIAGGPMRLVRRLLGRNRTVVELEPVTDNSEFQLGRYAAELVDRGAVASIRELAASSVYHHYFQKGDQAKYIKIVERQLFQIKGEFLAEHNVDLGDHNRNQTNIIDNSTTTNTTIRDSQGFAVGPNNTVNNHRAASQQEPS